MNVGDGVTVGIGSDRNAGTVQWVSKSGKTLRFTMDKQTRVDKNGAFSEMQEYEYESVPVNDDGTNLRSARWSDKRNGYIYMGRKLGSGRFAYRDPHF